MAAEKIVLTPVGAFEGSIRPPGSKSITNRALVCAALGAGESILNNALFSEDTEVMISCLQRLGITVEPAQAEKTIRVVGGGGKIPASSAELYTANSGTTMRFLTAMVALGRGVYRLDGNPRMRERPIEDLLTALRALGVEAFSEKGDGCPPVVVRSTGEFGGDSEVSGEISSQFLSGLLMAMPCAPRPVTVRVRGRLVSRPYVEMTLAVMEAFGIRLEREDLVRFSTPGRQKYTARPYWIEPDASAASYFFGAAAVTGGKVTVEGLGRYSLQGDVQFCHCLEQMGCKVTWGTEQITVCGGKLRGIDVDMNAISDTVPTLGVVALFAEGPTTIRGVAHIRHKETDRIAALAAELSKMGAEVEEFPDGLRIVPREPHPAEIETYNDHRMAMSFSLAALKVPGVIIRDPACTAKTYPEFFHDLSTLTGTKWQVIS
ncbi:MAG: 3-phosphoshikimate 1-carboxyvinyltransferase [Thermoguttaceae bacterium]|nr:3-phosphoshikimate 1-carboxyvinyltransferase [Thermoguttaceae bacterium]MDW8078661.1 3-phosphoshikimate 1-carboxyvinyltransferase [Thermoguttaceae bacterium]